MIERVIEWSIRNRFLVLILAAALAVAGVFAVFRTPMDAIPDLSENQVIGFADWMGRSPREIEDQVTYPLSRKLQGLAGVRPVRSASQLNEAPGVSDVAVVGGTPMEYQIDVRPEDLRSYNLTIGDLYSAVARSNMPAGGGVVQKNNAEYIVRGVGWIRDERDIENTVIKEVNGVPLYVKSIATVQLGTQFRRSVYEKNGNEVTGGAVLMRHGQNPLTVTQAVK